MSEERPAPLPPGLLVPQTNALAIAALITSIMSITSCCGLTSIVGVVLGHKARAQIRETGEQGAGMALAGTIIGWVGVAMVFVVVTILIVLGITDSSSGT